ncbi:hypothetical protein [Aliamphritea spongicola]|nr:hypothetical protein [Aliamphritea spongicola]
MTKLNSYVVPVPCYRGKSPAKHIVIENPKSGDSPMNRSDFLNLSGRAGRLVKEFQGNIWCVQPDEWEESVYKGEKLQIIESSLDSIMKDGGRTIQELISNFDLNSKEYGKAEMAFGKLYNDYRSTDSLEIFERFRTDSNTVELDKTIEKVTSLSVTVPDEILEKNKAIRADYLQFLYDFIENYDDLNDLKLLYPYATGAKSKMITVIELFALCLGWDLKSESYKNLISGLAYSWIKGDSLKDILNTRVKYILANTEKAFLLLLEII